MQSKLHSLQWRAARVSNYPSMLAEMSQFAGK